MPSAGMQQSLPLAVATDAFCTEHVAPPHHDEDPERFLAAQTGFERSQAAKHALRLPARAATVHEIVRAHTPAFVAQILASRGSNGWFDPDTYYSPGSADVALRATGAALALTDAVLGDAVRQGVGIWRPPGHHSCADRALGFCLFNHVAVAARHAQTRGAARVLVLDWDVHHGNGTQEIFESDPSVLYISLHQGRPQYPETGAANETGRGEGRGYTVNLPLSVGANGATYAAAFERVVLPIVEQYQPDLTLISAGYDAHERDPLGGMCLRSEDYGWFTQQVLRTLGGPQRARLGIYLEGGYHRAALTDSVQSTINALIAPAEVAHPTSTGRRLSPRHAAELAHVEKIQRAFWKL
ncbi:MAG: hypothetical protein RL701_4283 [Pseudomonadota bacterium]